MGNAYLIDLDGTLYRGDQKIKYADTFIRHLNDTATPYLAVTNCPSRSAEEVSQKLKGMGIDISPAHVLTSGRAAAAALYALGYRKVFALGTRALQLELHDAGLEVTDQGAEAVLVGYDPAMTYGQLAQTCVLARQGAAVYATNIDNAIPDGERFIPHTGAIARAVECASGKACTYFGKPGRAMFDTALGLLGCPASDCVVIGDRLDTDIGFANKCGVRSVLVLTGATSREDLATATERPDRVCADLSELL